MGVRVPLRTRGLALLGVAALMLLAACDLGGGGEPTENAGGEQVPATEGAAEGQAQGDAGATPQATPPQAGAAPQTEPGTGATGGTATEPREDVMPGPTDGPAAAAPPPAPVPAPGAGAQEGTTGGTGGGLTDRLAGDDFAAGTADDGSAPVGGTGTGAGGAAPTVNVALLAVGALSAAAGVAAIARRGGARE